MKKLYLLRHAEAEKKAGLADFERALTPFGKAQALRLGEHMKEKNITPELVICSDSLRARQTLEAVNDVLRLPPATLIYEHKLYNCGLEELKSQILNTRDSVNYLMLVAHNPSITTLPLNLRLSGKIEGIDDFDSTCKFVAIQVDAISWNSFLTAKCIVESIFCP